MTPSGRVTEQAEGAASGLMVCGVNLPGFPGQVCPPSNLDSQPWPGTGETHLVYKVASLGNIVPG